MANVQLSPVGEKLNNFILWIKRNRTYSLGGSEVGLNLGCEHETIPSFVGVDGNLLIYLSKIKFIPSFINQLIFNKSCTSKYLSFEEFLKIIKNKRIIHHNLANSVPFKNNSVKYIFTSHFLEHLTENKAKRLIIECFRVLKPGGKIRIIVPDLDEEIRIIEKKIKQYKKNNKIQPFQEYFIGESKIIGEFGTHKKIYNFTELKRILVSTGFKEVTKFKRFSGTFPNLKELDVREGLIVEATKEYIKIK